MQSKDDGYIQVGVTALRDPSTGGYLPAVPLYINADESAFEAQQSFFEDIGHLFALQIKAYMDGCREAGVEP